MGPQATRKLVDVVQSLSQSRSLDEIVSIVRVAARELVGSDGASFILRDNGYCFYVDEDAVGPLWKGQRFPMSACVSGWAMNHKEKVVIPDIYQDPRVPIEAYRPTFVKSMAMVPIRAKDPIGAIGNYWNKTYTPTDEQVEIMQALADITSVSIENVKLYTDLQQRVEELKSSNAAKDSLLKIVSHELKTPLTAIHGWAGILKTHDLSEKEKESAVSTIFNSAQDQLRIVNDLLDTSQMILKRLSLEKRPLEFSDVVKKSIALEKPKLDQKNVLLDYDSDSQLMPVLGDEERLIQLVRNLISNAIKFSPKEGSISVFLRHSGPNIELEITDYGAGISPEMLPHLFERFKQEDDSNTRAYGGLGLGLAISQFLAEAHDGKVNAHSEGKGKGARFTVTLPLICL